MQRSYSFSIQTHVLGKGLRNEQLEAKRYEVSDRPSILLEISSRKSLISRVEEGNEVVLLHRQG